MDDDFFIRVRGRALTRSQDSSALLAFFTARGFSTRGPGGEIQGVELGGHGSLLFSSDQGAASWLAEDGGLLTLWSESTVVDVSLTVSHRRDREDSDVAFWIDAVHLRTDEGQADGLLGWARTAFEGLLEHLCGLAGYANRQGTDWELRRLLGDRGHSEEDHIVAWRLPHWLTFVPERFVTPDFRGHLSQAGAKIDEVAGGWIIQLGSLNETYGATADALQEWWLANLVFETP